MADDYQDDDQDMDQNDEPSEPVGQSVARHQQAPPQQAPVQPNWTQVAQAPMAPPIPFGQAQQMRLTALQGGLTAIQSQIDNDQLSPEDAAEPMRKIQGMIAPLLASKQQTQALAERQQNTQLMKAEAQRQAIIQANAGHDATNFHARTAMQMDPATGQTAHFFMKEPGKWEQVDFGNTPQANQPTISASHAGGPTDPNRGAVASADVTAGVGSSESKEPPLADMDTVGEADRPVQSQATIPIGPDGQPLTDQPRIATLGDPINGYHQIRVPSLAERSAMDAATPEQQAGIADQIGRGTFGQQPSSGGGQSIRNGPYTDQYQNGQLVSTNRPSPSTASVPAGAFTPGELQHARNVADAVTAGMPAGFHRDVQHGAAERQVLLATAHQKEEDRRATAALQLQQSKAATNERSKAAAALEQERKESRQNAYKSVDEEYKAHAAAKAKDANYTIPAQYATAEARLAEAQRIHRESWAASHPDSQEAKDIAAGTATSAATAPSDMDKIAALGKAAETHYNTPGQQGFFYNTSDADTAKAMLDVLTPAFHENRPLTSAERQQYDTLQKTIADPQLRDRLDWNGKFAQQAKGTAGTVQRGPSGAPVYRDPKVAVTVNARLKELGLGEKTKAESGAAAVQQANEEEHRRNANMPERFK